MSDPRFDIRFRGQTTGIFRGLAAVGAVTFLAGLALAPERAWSNLLLVSYALVGLGLGGVFFVAAQYLTGAGWATALRRVPEAMATLLPYGAVGMLAVIIFYPGLYPWTDPSPELGHLMFGFKKFWLNRPFFIARGVVYLALWYLMTRAIVTASRRQDEDGDVRHTQGNGRRSAVFMVVFGATYSLASFDWIMSLEPEWYSTIFGIYNFSGMFIAALAVMVLLSVWLRASGPFRNVLTDDHLHDLGRLMLGFSTFWVYIWFSQYMLIWYANIPEETGYFAIRHKGAWTSLFLLNVVVNWAIPFFALLRGQAKRSSGMMARVAGVILVGRWLDLYLMILPPVSGSAEPTFGLWEIGLLAGAIGAVPLILLQGMRGAAPVPLRDPLLQASLHHRV